MYYYIGKVKYTGICLLALSLGCGGASGTAGGARSPTAPPGDCPPGEVHDLGSRDVTSELTIQPVGDETMVAWRTGLSAVRLVHLKAGAPPRGDELFLADTARPTKHGPLVAWSGSRYLVGWLEEEASGSSSLQVRRFTRELREEGEVVPVVEEGVTGEALLAHLDGRFVVLWASGRGRSLLRHATVDPETAATRTRIVGAGSGPFEELQGEPYAGGLLVSWRGGRIIVEANGDARGLPSETGARERDPRPPSWTQKRVPMLPEAARGFGRGLPRGDELLVPWMEEQEEGGSRVRYAAFGADGRLVRGPWEVAETAVSATSAQLGIGPIGEAVGIVYVDQGGTRVRVAVSRPCG